MDMRILSWSSTVTDKPNSFLRFGREIVKGANSTSPIVRSRSQSENGDANLRSSCIRQMSDSNAAAMSRRVSLLRFALNWQVPETLQQKQESRMGSQNLAMRLPIRLPVRSTFAL